MFTKSNNPFSKSLESNTTRTPTKTEGVVTTSATSATATSNKTLADTSRIKIEENNATQSTANVLSNLSSEFGRKAPSAHNVRLLVVGAEVELRSAEINTCDLLVVEGKVEATLESKKIRVMEGGVYSGKVTIDHAEIFGCFDGDLTAKEQLIIHANGKVKGTIRYGKILIEEGGEISGDIKSIDPSSYENQKKI